MSKYTTELRYMVESGFDLQMTSYPIFNEAYRAQLNQKIIDHFYFREIGFETPGLFRNRLNVRMNEIMPYFNQLYKSALLDISPLVNEIYTETFQRHTADEKASARGVETVNKQVATAQNKGHRTSQEQTEDSGESRSETEGRTVHSDTPQGLLSMSDIENELYASDAAISFGEARDSHTNTATHGASEDTTSTGTNNVDATGKTSEMGSESGQGWEDFTRKIEGARGVSQSGLLNEFRSTFLNIDMLVINELNDLFMGVF